MKKLTMLVVGAAGYVLGTRAGRERYEEIKTKAMTFWNDPKVQNTVDDAKSKVTDKVKGGDDADPASDTYRPGDEAVGPPPVPGGSRIADAAREGTS